MKTTIAPHRADAGLASIVACAPLLTLGMLVLVAGFFTGANRAFPGAQESKAAAEEQGQSSYVDEAEEKAYRAAKREPDEKKRAAQLYAFYQKYPNSRLMESADFEIIKPVEEEYAAYYAATQEPDFAKRGAMFTGFLEKYPESAYAPNVESDYAILLREAARERKYELLESLAEKWLTIRPNSREAHAYLAEATRNLQKFEKSAEHLEAIYAMQPSPSLAKEIFLTYQKTQNPAKQAEWADRLFKMPEFEKDYMLRFQSTMNYASQNDLPKADEFAQLTLKSAGLIEHPDAKTQEQLREVRRVCHHIIGSDLMEKGNFTEAIPEFKKAIADEKYAEGYYKIGQCLENLKQIEEAMIYYARTVLMGGEYADKAKARLELLYKALHNDTLIGIEKIYNKAKEAADN